MAYVRVEQRNAHLAGAVQLRTVEGRDGPVSVATLTAISNTRRSGRGDGEERGEEATAIQWTVWGRQAENAAQYLGKGSHVNVTGRVQNDNYQRDGQTVYRMTFTAEEIDYLDSRAKGEALHARQRPEPETSPSNGARDARPTAPAPGTADRAARSRKAASKATATTVDDDIPF